MLMFTLAISCFTTSNLPWFMDLTFQIPMQYCCLQHRTLLLSPVTSTTGYCFCFGSVPSFFLESFVHWSPVAYWAPTNQGSSSFCIISFCLFILSWGSQGKITEVVCHSLLQWTTFCQTSPPWPARLGWPHPAWLSFIELDKAVVHVIRLISFLWLWFHWALGWDKLYLFPFHYYREQSYFQKFWIPSKLYHLWDLLPKFHLRIWGLALCCMAICSVCMLYMGFNCFNKCMSFSMKLFCKL